MWGWLGLPVAAVGFLILMGADPSYIPVVGSAIAVEYGAAGLILCIAAAASFLGLLSPSHSVPRQAAMWGALGLGIIVIFTRLDDFGGAVVQSATHSQSAGEEAQISSTSNDASNPAGADQPADVQPAEADANVSTELKADGRGHFVTDAEIDGTTVKVMVDTGASAVALSYEDADDAGLRPRTLDFDVPVSTANGVVNAARVSLRRVEVNGVEVRNVEGLILPEGVMRGTLLGMSFLSRLRSFKVEDGVLYLED
jgi:clan AA aspartic protease (TIGR02281 family)